MRINYLKSWDKSYVLCEIEGTSRCWGKGDQNGGKLWETTEDHKQDEEKDTRLSDKWKDSDPAVPAPKMMRTTEVAILKKEREARHHQDYFLFEFAITGTVFNQ